MCAFQPYLNMEADHLTVQKIFPSTFLTKCEEEERNNSDFPFLDIPIPKLSLT